MAIVLDHCQILPSPDAAPELSLPILFFDMLWYEFPANQSLVFFEFPCSKTHFLEVIVPGLKQSLSLTLSHFLPLSGKLVNPLKPGTKPVLRYVAGDSVSFTVSESNADFNHLTGNHPRSSDEFYAFAPQLPPAKRSVDAVECCVLALQATLFAGFGICLGFVTHHVAVDASTVVSFIQAWAQVNRWMPDRAGDIKAALSIQGNFLPFYDRKTVVDINGLDSLYWDLLVQNSYPVEPPPVGIPVDKTRATFLLKKEDIQKLKNFVLAKRPRVKHLSSFTVTCALVWVCSAKSAAPGGEEVAEDESEYFGFVADCRGRLDPPLPANYFGNCVALVKAELKHGVLKGDNGFVMAAGSIGEAIWEIGEKGVLHAAMDWDEEYGKLIGKRLYGVAGSQRFDFYAADFGWGRPKKFEALFIDGSGSISLCKSKEFDGGLEIGLSKPKAKMEAFAAVFTAVLKDLLLQ